MMTLIRYLIYFVLGYVIYTTAKKWLTRKSKQIRREEVEEEEEETLVQDPNCLTFISIKQAIAKKQAGQIHYFCSKECAEAFLQKSHTTS